MFLAWGRDAVAMRPGCLAPAEVLFRRAPEDRRTKSESQGL